MKRTTIFANEDLMYEIEQLSRKKKVSAASLIREALEAYVRKESAHKGFSFVGIGKSGRRDVSERADELLWKRAAGKKKRGGK